MYIDVNVNHDNARLWREMPIVEGSSNFYTLRCLFSDEWDNVTKYVIFPEYECSIALTDGEAIIPPSIVSEKGKLRFGILGISDDGQTKITTNILTLKIIESAGDSDAPPPSDELAAWEDYINNIVSEQTMIKEEKTADPSDDIEVIEIGSGTEVVNIVFGDMASKTPAVGNTRINLPQEENGAVTINMFFPFRTAETEPIYYYFSVDGDIRANTDYIYMRYLAVAVGGSWTIERQIAL